VAQRPSGPLSGLLVADFSRILAGPYATMLLADLGADVVKVESPAGDDTRTWQPPVRDGVATYYLGVNRNKRSVALDLKDDGDVALAQALAARADVLIENFRPGGLDRFGLGYDDVSAANPGIIYASISGFGTTERGRALPGYDLIVQAMSGLMSLTGGPDTGPYRSGISVFDVMAGLHATIGILSALHARDVNGRGQHVEVNLLASALSGMVNQTSAYVAAGVVPQRMGNSHPSLFPYEPLPCADGDLIITAGNNAQFRKLVEVLGVPELAEDPLFLRNEDRTANRDELRPLLVERLQTRSKMDWFREIIAAGVPCGPINTVDGGVAFAEEIGQEPVVEVGEGDAMVPSVRHPITFSETPVDYRFPPPGLDEHGDEIRRWLSGDLPLVEEVALRPSRDHGDGTAGTEGLVTGASAPSSTNEQGDEEGDDE
jgi:crotonobetainyl-CoA:carnitine CoA-transferase CaiB-like acyl-CoA transferase